MFSLPSQTLRLITLSLVVMSMAPPAQALDAVLDQGISHSTLFTELAERGEIHIDRRPPPRLPDPILRRRDAEDTAEPTSVAAPSTASGSAPSSSPTATSAPDPSDGDSTSLAGGTDTADSTETATSTLPSSVAQATPTVLTSLPTPFDTPLGSNFSDASCPQFFHGFLNNATFQSCVPVSLLLQNSNSFFQAERSSTLLTQTLDVACNAPLAICSPLLAAIASDLIAGSNCGRDFNKDNPLVTQAYAGLIAYEPVYRATCLRDDQTGAYCFSEAITNASSPGDFYPYYTALGLSMPEAAHPTCSQCLKDTMHVFAGYAQNGAQPLAKTYAGCAQQVDAECGTGFAASVQGAAAQKKNGAARLSAPASLLVATGMSIWVLLMAVPV